jgi:hypothetical protein
MSSGHPADNPHETRRRVWPKKQENLGQVDPTNRTEKAAAQKVKFSHSVKKWRKKSQEQTSI